MDDKLSAPNIDGVIFKELPEIAKNISNAMLKASVSEAEIREGSNSLDGGLKGEFQPVVLEMMDGTEEALALPEKQATKSEVEELTEKQRQKMIQYEKDRAFFEAEVLKSAREVSTINEDYIKILHPKYRAAFLKGVAQYGTLAAGLRYMRDTYGLKVRGDVLRRMRNLIPVFDVEIEDALMEYQGAIQIEMHRRAVEGVERGVWFQGEQVGTEKQYSDALLAKMMDVHAPEYKEVKQKGTEKGNTINVQIIKDFHNYKKEQ